MENDNIGKIICITGSNISETLFRQEEKRLILEGYIVITTSLQLSKQDLENTTDQQKEILLKNIDKKIRMCDILYVIDENKYTSFDTDDLIRYAKDCQKEIFYYENKNLNMYENSYPINDMTKKKTWNEFLDTGLLLQANQLLHNFGYAITVSLDGDNNVIEVYPARVKFRGFGEKSIDKSYTKVAKYLKENVEELFKEVEE